MKKQIIKIHNVETGEVIEREMTSIEKLENENFQKKIFEEKVEIEAKTAARQAIADRLGLTVDELQVLLG